MRSSTSPRRKSDSGSALIEVLVAIVLGSLLIGIVLHADLAVNRRILRWSAQSQLEQAAVTLSSKIRRDIALSDSVVNVDTLALELIGRRGQVRYSFRDGQVARNGKLLLKDGDKATRIKVACVIDDATSTLWTDYFDETSDKVLTVSLSMKDHGSQTVSIPLRPLGSVRIE